ncbi:DNA polymerase III subunit beta [Patescibacteria group bacterium]|nr:DNA polymerase III subunit beta [Patescibacteria group bacterium]
MNSNQLSLIILQEKLKNGLNVVGRVSPKSYTLPILNNILIQAEKNFLQLSTTDLEVGINWWSLAKIEKEGKITIPTKIISSFVNFLPNKPMKLEVKGSNLLIESENYKTQIKSFSADEFPIIPHISEEKKILVDNSAFCQGLETIVNFAQPSTARPEISGIYFSFEKELIKMVATDSFRLGEKKLFLEKPLSFSQKYSLILPQKAARELINVFGEKKGELKICLEPNQALFEIPMAETPHPQVQLVSRLIEGGYPDYQAIIPKKYKTQLFLPKNEFLNQVKLASLFSGKINEVKFKIEKKKEGIEIFSQDPDLGEHRSFLPGEINGEEVTVSFNHRFLIDGLLNIKSKDLIFELNGEDGPGALKPVGDQSYIYILMPIKAS